MSFGNKVFHERNYSASPRSAAKASPENETVYGDIVRSLHNDVIYLVQISLHGSATDFRIATCTVFVACKGDMDLVLKIDGFAVQPAHVNTGRIDGEGDSAVLAELFCEIVSALSDANMYEIEHYILVLSFRIYQRYP